MGVESLALGAKIGGTALSTIGAFRKSTTDKAALEYQAKVAENNAALEEMRAGDAVARGQVTAARVGLKTRQLKGSQRTALAEKGISLGEGSALNILTSTDYMGAIDANTAMDNANLEAWAIRNGASNYRANSGLLKNRAGAESPWGAAASTLLTGAGSVADSWYRFRDGVFTPSATGTPLGSGRED